MRIFKSALLQRFTGSDEGPFTQYLGCQLIRDRPNRPLNSCKQPILMASSAPLTCGMRFILLLRTRLVKTDCPETPNPTLQRRYRSIVGSIGYLVQMTRCGSIGYLVQMTRCDMAFAYGQLSLFLHNPGPVHIVAAERVPAYVRGTHDQGLSYCDPGAENQTF